MTKAIIEAKSDEKKLSKNVGPPPLKQGVDYINTGEEDQMEIQGFRPHLVQTIFTWILILITGGVLRLIFHWKPHWMLKFTHTRCQIEDAKKVLLVDQFMQKFTENITHLSSKTMKYSGTKECASYGLVRLKSKGAFESTNYLTFFENKKVRYIWDTDKKQYFKVCGLDRDVSCDYFYQQNGLSSEDQEKRQILYGKNDIKVEVNTIIQILYKEVLEPFYIFQIFSFIIWSIDDYYWYASCIFVMTALSLATGVIQTRRNQKQLRDTVEGVDSVIICRDNIYEKRESTDLVPGDVIEVPAFGGIMQCDAVLISGNVIVNESMLTGESVPVTKTPLPNTTINESYNTKEHAKHTLFCGTKVIQTRYYNNAKVKAVVIRTAYQTSKGELIRSILFPKPVDFKFHRHIHYFIGCMAGLALIGFVYTVVLKSIRGVPAFDIAIKAIDLLTIIIPPALPAAMTIGVVFAQSRLKSSGIFCISPRSISISGCVNCVCFDKTGTLTEDDLSFAEVVPVDTKKHTFSSPVNRLPELEFGPLLTCLTTCHSLTIIDDNLLGDSLDVKMFEATEWQLEEPEVGDTEKYDLLAPSVVKPKGKGLSGPEVGILRQFQFSSSLQRMSVITRVLNDTDFVLYAKGAPEMITSLCIPNSIPEDFNETLMVYTNKGFRVLALAYRPLPTLTYPKMQRAAREDLERDLHFLGLLIMGNMLKPETPPVIETLLTANIRTVMITGDNMLTALSVARECYMIQPHHKVILLESETNINSNNKNIIPNIIWKYADTGTKRKHSFIKYKSLVGQEKDNLHLALTGGTFKLLRDYYPDLLNKVVIRGTVFSRMAPQQKQQLVELLQDLGYTVAMCGDGANDMASLKQAHAGVSLSEAEASVASPFTSKTPNISCIPTLIREGRACIVTAFGILKYIASYSMIQFFSVIILYTFYSNLTDKEFLFIDMFLITICVTLFGRTKAYDKLHRIPPPSSLMGLAPLSSITLQILLMAFIQVIAVFIVTQQKWYIKTVPEDVYGNNVSSHDNYAVFASSVFQYITLAVVFSKGAPYRKSVFTNRLFLLALVLMCLLTAYLVIYPHEWIEEFFELDLSLIPISFRIAMVGLAVGHLVIALFLEKFITDYLIFKKVSKWFPCLAPKDTLYKIIDNETNLNTQWLPKQITSNGLSKESNYKISSDISSNLTNNNRFKQSFTPESNILSSNNLYTRL